MASRISKPSIFIALIVAASIISSAYSYYNKMEEKKTAQINAYNSFVTWKAEYNSWKPKNEEWIKVIPDYSMVSDLSSLLKVINLPNVDPDTLTVSDISEFKSKSGEVRALKVCLSSGGSAGISIRGSSYSELFNISKTLLSRPDFIASSMHIKSDTHGPVLDLNQACVLFRSENYNSSK